MDEEESNEKLFEGLFKDKIEKKIIQLIVDGKDYEEIIDILVESEDGVSKWLHLITH